MTAAIALDFHSLARFVKRFAAVLRKFAKHAVASKLDLVVFVLAFITTSLGTKSFLADPLCKCLCIRTCDHDQCFMQFCKATDHTGPQNPRGGYFSSPLSCKNAA